MVKHIKTLRLPRPTNSQAQPSMFMSSSRQSGPGHDKDTTAAGFKTNLKWEGMAKVLKYYYRHGWLHQALYGAPQLTSQLVEQATEEVQGSSDSDTASAVVMIIVIVLVQHYTKPNHSLV